MRLDAATLKELLKQSERNRKVARKAFDEHDNHDDLKSLEAWSHTSEWLKAKLSDLKTRA